MNADFNFGNTNVVHTITPFEIDCTTHYSQCKLMKGIFWDAIRPQENPNTHIYSTRERYLKYADIFDGLSVVELTQEMADAGNYDLVTK